MMLTELRKVIPSFLKRVDLPDRGDQVGAYASDIASGWRTSRRTGFRSMRRSPVPPWSISLTSIPMPR
ncbi:MAG: hypothetical protein CM1200mP26_11470 [Acidimicrobiales bacterium]|nr:MAG: hypothetical protein CM1200mP26_11470 [Acidimicrobiales bacterium]